MKRFIEHPGEHYYEIIVIGGGISGAAVAYEAASQGYSVALVEKGDFGAGTSAATSKLIHGGLRYLANFELGLVRESLKERKTLENIAPNLVDPLPFLVPLYKTGERKKLILEPGMILYDLLSYDKGFTWDPSKKMPWHRLLARQKAVQMEPLIEDEALTGAILYYDCANFNQERLTLAFVKSAVQYGAAVANYAQVEDFAHTADRITGVIVRDLLQGQTLTVHGRLVVNCAGPWADLVLDIARGKGSSQHIRRSEGIHLIVPRLTSGQAAIGGLTPSGRPCNLIPWRGHTLIGTTDQEYVGDPDDYRVTRPKIEAYIAEVNAAFGKPDLLKYSDVRYAYGGLRPLVDDQTEDVYKTSRKYEIFDHEQEGLPGLITVEGGKYTTSRNLAENVLKVVGDKFQGKKALSITARQYLAGCDIPDLRTFIGQAQAAYQGFPEANIAYLARLYGTELPALMQIAQREPAAAIPVNADGEMPAQALYAIRAEMARTLLDILIRRTGIGTLGYPGDDVVALLGKMAGRELQWSQARLDQELETAKKELCVPS
jgi:glycerol-3-phosphate dehydrogenase